MDHIDQTISHLRAQITALHNNTMNYKPPEIYPLGDTVIALKMSTLQIRINQLEAELEGYKHANKNLRDEVERLKQPGIISQVWGVNR